MKKTYSKFSDAFKDDKTLMWSFSRLTGAVLLVWVFVVSSWLIYNNGDISANVVSLINTFVLFAGGAYGVNKGVSHFSRYTPTFQSEEDEYEA